VWLARERPANHGGGLTDAEQWLVAIHADSAPGTAAERVIVNRPADLSDACLSSTTKINEVFGYQLAGECERLFPTFGDTRTAAGGGLTGDTFKRQPKPLDFTSYPVTFTAAQQARLQAPSLPESALEQAGRRRAATARRRLARLRPVTGLPERRPGCG
jgi:hypothetical protein